MVASADCCIFYHNGARELDGQSRLNLSLQVLAHQQPITTLATTHAVSRNFCYQQAHKAQAALQQAFAPVEEDSKVLFHLPVTKNWIRQFVLAQLLIGHTSDRGVLELSRTLLDYDGLSLGTIHNIAQQAVALARSLNRQEDLRLLPRVRVGAHDEIFQGKQPVLVGVDVLNTYCYLLASEEHRDAESWGVHLLELEESGLHPDRTVADAGKALRSAQSEVWGQVPCHGDVFHAERELGRAAYFLERRAAAVQSECQALAAQLERCRRDYGHGERGRRRRERAQKLAGKVFRANKEGAKASPLAEEVALLSRWFKEDVLAIAGEDLEGRRELFDFIVEELARREPLCPHRLGPVRRMLQEQREQLLCFVEELDQELEDLSDRTGICLYLVREMSRLKALDPGGCLYWQRRERLRRKLGHRFFEMEQAVDQVLAGAVRSSSAVENLNSRLRCYFFLRRQLGDDYLELLRFFLNHRPYLRSRRSERTGKSPAQLLGEEPHPHWLEMLGYRRFCRN